MFEQARQRLALSRFLRSKWGMLLHDPTAAAPRRHPDGAWVHTVRRCSAQVHRRARSQSDAGDGEPDQLQDLPAVARGDARVTSAAEGQRPVLERVRKEVHLDSAHWLLLLVPDRALPRLHDDVRPDDLRELSRRKIACKGLLMMIVVEPLRPHSSGRMGTVRYAGPAGRRGVVGLQGPAAKGWGWGSATPRG